MRTQCRCISRTFYSRTYTQFPGVFTLQSVQSCVSLLPVSLSTYTLSLKPSKSSEYWLFSPRGLQGSWPSASPLKQVRPQLCPYPQLNDSKQAGPASPLLWHPAPSPMRSNSQCKLDQRIFVEQVRDCMDNGYLLPSKKIGSAAFSRVYLAYATRECMKHNPKLSSDLRGKNHIMVREACHFLCGFIGVTQPGSSKPVLYPLRYLPATLASSIAPPS